MTGLRKFKIVIFGVSALLAGFIVAAICKVDSVIYGAYSVGVVGACGWFFKANVDEHKTNNGG